MRSIAILGCNLYSQITVAHLTLPKAVRNTVKIFAVYLLTIKIGSHGKKANEIFELLSTEFLDFNC